MKRTRNTTPHGLMRRLLSLIMVMTVLLTSSVIMSSADSYYTIRINYVFADGTPAHDPYVATYEESTDSLDLTVTNPSIDGYVPMTAVTDGVSAYTSEFHLDHIDHNINETVYYVAGLTNYRVMYYKQNIYDDMYSRDNSVPERYTSRYGYTGTNPTELETENLFPGFTNLFHEPDAIAADGQTVFRVYYDRNYYTVKFDLGVGSYGVEPVYSKYQTSYHIGAPTRLGYTFIGWARTSADSSVGEEGVDWYYIPMDADASAEGFDPAAVSLTEAQAKIAAVAFNDGVIPAYDTYYKAMWEPGTTKFSIVYWIENPQSELTEADYEGVTDDDARALLSQNYTVAAVKDVYQYADGTPVDADDQVDGETWIKNAQGQSMQIKDFFSYNLNYADPDEPRNDPQNANYDPAIRYDVNDKKIDFLDISKGASDDISGHRDFFTMVWDTEDTDGFFLEDSSKTVAGDGTTRLNFYFSRKVFTLKFIYARQKLVNGQPTGEIDLTNSTKNFSKYDYISNTSRTYKNAAASGTWRTNIAETLPHIKPQYLEANGGKINEEYYDYSGYRYFYYHFDAKYNAPLERKWLIDAITPVQRSLSDTLSPGEMLNPGSWAVEFGTKYYYDHTTVNNFTIKGIYDKLGDDLMFTAANRATMTSNNKSYTELHYLLSWTNTGEKPNSSWNVGKSHMLRFTYESYVELLLWQTEIIDEEGAAVGVQMLKDMDLYDDIMQHSYTKQDGTTVTKWYGLPLKWVELYSTEVQRMQEDQDGDGQPDGSDALTGDGTYKKVKFDESDGKYYGLKSIYRVETVDSGGQYESTTASNTRNVRTNQTAADISGFEIEYLRKTAQNSDPNAYFVVDGQTSGAEVKKYRDEFKKDQVILDDCNTIVDWSDDQPTNRHATIKFFYRRRDYTLSYRNGNEDVESARRSVKYDAPLNRKYDYDDVDGQYQAGDWRYYYENPEYFNPDLRDYYEFKGWYFTPYYFRQVNIDTTNMPADDLTLYAKWEPKTIQVTFYNTYNDYYEDINRIADPVDVHYGSYIDNEDIPANVAAPESNRPVMTPPAEGAMFAGWYYLRDNIPVRFEPENIPVTALNKESSGSNGTFHLYAEWVTKDVGKYEITYVEKNNPNNEVAPPTIGRAFVWKTRTFNAKGGSDLNEEHMWEENARNWYPTVNSHSLVIKSNSQSSDNPYAPNTYAFEYIQKDGVYYRVEYLDRDSHASLIDPATIGKNEVYSTDASVKEDAPFIEGYIAEKMSQFQVLSASVLEDSAAQKAEELENNVITFYYVRNDTEYMYEVEYYKQNLEDNDYSLFQTENYTVPIAADDPSTAEVERTMLSIDEVYGKQYFNLFAVNGCTYVPSATQICVTHSDGTVTTRSLGSDTSIEITGTEKTTIKLYFDRDLYPYTYDYVDYRAEREYLDTPEAERGGMWNGVMASFTGSTTHKVEAEVIINVPTDYTYNGTPYLLINEDVITLTIAPATESNPNINHTKVYYKKFTERELQYKLVCINENESYADVDYDVTKTPAQPLFGGLSMTSQTVNSYEDISSVKFFDYNDAKITSEDAGGSPLLDDLHNHRYTFLGWYDNPEGTGEPLVAYDPSNPTAWYTITNADLGLDGELPERNTTYFAIVEQDTVRANFEFRYTDQELPIGGDSGETPEDIAAAAIVTASPTDADGSIVGKEFSFRNPRDYVNNSLLPYDKHLGYSLDIVEKDDRVYKYEFAEWWEEDLVNNKMVRKKNWNSDSEWAPTTIESQLDRRSDKHLIAVYKRRDVVSINYVINYNFYDRLGNERTYVKTGTLSGDDLNEDVANPKITTDGDYRLTDEFIMANAPFESNYGQTLFWKDTNIEKTSIRADADDDDDYVSDTIIVTVNAEQDVQTVHAHYRTTPSGSYTDLVLNYGDNWLLNSNMKAITAEETITVGGEEMSFSYWAVRKTETGEVIAKSYDTLFDLCMMGNYWISPVYTKAVSPAEGRELHTVALDVSSIAVGNERWAAWTWYDGDDSSGVWVDPNADLVFSGIKDKVIFVRMDGATSENNWDNKWNQTGNLDVVGRTFTMEGWGDNGSMYGRWANITLTYLDYTRNRWTDSSVNPTTGNTDLLYTDFEIAFENCGEDIFTEEGDEPNGYQVGVIFERCGKWNPSIDYVQGTDYGFNFVTHEDNLKAAIKGSATSGKYVYDTANNLTRSYQICRIPTGNLTNKNRVQFAQPYKNAYKVTNGTTTYTNSTYILKVTAYMYKDNGDVTLSNPVYICLSGIAGRELALGNGIVNPVSE